MTADVFGVICDGSVVFAAYQTELRHCSCSLVLAKLARSVIDTWTVSKHGAWVAKLVPSSVRP